MVYTETKKFSITSQIHIYITDIHVEINTNLIRFFAVHMWLQSYPIPNTATFHRMERSACHKKVFQKDKMSIFWTFSAYIGDGFWQFWWTLTYQRQSLYTIQSGIPISKIEKVPRGIRGEESSKDMASSRNLVSTIGALASPKMGDGTRCPEG